MFTRSSARRRKTSASRVTLIGLGTTWRTVAGAICSSSSSKPCVSAMPQKIHRARVQHRQCLPNHELGK
ncbi:MAG: hypothetical protein WDO74_16685 [Pseudomonadota bacterium]